MRLSPQFIWFVFLVTFARPVAADPDATGTHVASPGAVLMIQAAPGAWHLNSDPHHAEHSWLLGVEWLHGSRWLAGYSYFNNSFDQKSHYLYGGRWWPFNKNDTQWYFKLTAGVIAGYKEPYEDKIPFNHNGIAPGIVPGLGYKMNRWNAQLNLVGKGLMLTVGYDLIR